MGLKAHTAVYTFVFVAVDSCYSLLDTELQQHQCDHPKTTKQSILNFLFDQYSVIILVK